MKRNHSSLSICFLAPLFHPVLGGSETYTLMLALGLQERGHKIAVITDLREPGSPPRELFQGVEIFRTQDYRRNLDGPGRVPWEECVFGLLRDIHDLSRDRHFDLIHAQNQVSALLGAMIKQSLGSRLVCTMHEQFPERDAFGVGRSKVVYGLLPYDLIIAGSDFYRKQALTFGAPPEMVRLIYHGTDLKRFRPGLSGSRVRERLSLSDQFPLVVLSGRFSPRKGQLEFVQAMAKVRESISEVRGCLVGGVSSASSSYFQSVREEIIRLSLEDSIFILEEEYRWHDMPEVYAAANLVVQPSHGEGLGLALIEAMSCGKPVVGTDVTGIREVISSGENGLLVPPRDPKRLAEAIVDLLTDKEKATRLATSGLADARNRFSAERMVEEVEQAYYDLVQQN